MAGVFETSGMPDTVDNAGAAPAAGPQLPQPVPVGTRQVVADPDWLRFDRLTVNLRGRVLGDDRPTACETWEEPFGLADDQELYSAYDKLKELKPESRTLTIQPTLLMLDSRTTVVSGCTGHLAVPFQWSLTVSCSSSSSV